MADVRQIRIAPLSGVDERWTANAPSASVAQDLYYDPRQGFQSSGGYKRIIRGPSDQEGGFRNPFEGVGPISSIHWMSQHNGARRWLIYVTEGGAIYTFNPSTAARSASPGDVAKDRAGNTITRTSVQTPWQRDQSACWGDWLYLVNGVDPGIVWNGYFWDMAGWQGPAGTPSATAMAHPHAIDSGSPPIFMQNIGLGPVSEDADVNYKFARRYKCSFVNDRGAESPLSEASDIVTFTNVSTSGAHFASLTLPIGPASCVARRVYCTINLYDSSNQLVTGRDTQFYFAFTVPDNVTALVQDGLDDAYLASEAVNQSALGAWPMQAKYIASFKGRLYATGVGNSAVYYSRRGSPEVWPPDNVLDIGDANLGPTTAIYATQNALVVAKARGLYLIKDDGVNDPTAETLTRESGWSSQNTVCEVPGMGVIGLSDDGLTVLQGTLQNTGTPTGVINAAVGLPNIFRSLNRSAILNACAAFYHRDKELWIAIPTIGAPNNRLVLVYHTEVREWTTREGFPISSMLETPDSAGQLLFGSWDDDDHEGIFVYTRAADDKDGVSIAPVYQTGQVSIASQFGSFRPKRIAVNGIGHGNNPLTVNIASNYSLTNWMPEAKSVIQQLPSQILPTYGTARFDQTGAAQAAWQTWHPITMRVDVDGTNQAPVLAVTIRLEPAEGTRYMTLMALSLDVSPDDPTKVAVLKPDGS
jgi:hypothetical protein